MASTKLEDVFERLRQMFQARLEGECVDFVALSARLARSEEEQLSAFDALAFRAHRLQGGAAMFQEPEIAVAAGRLEHAAELRLASDVRSALEVLLGLMRLRLPSSPSAASPP